MKRDIRTPQATRGLSGRALQPLGGSPLHMPYHVIVRPGLDVGSSPMPGASITGA